MLTGANMSGADVRGAYYYLADTTGANTSNLIQPDGHIAGLNLMSGTSLSVRDYDGRSTVAPVIVDQYVAMDGGTLQLVFDADAWDSPISFAPGIPVARGGTLELAFAPGVDVASQIGRTIKLFDWTGVAPGGTFTIASSVGWDFSQLYTTGEATLTSAGGVILGDFNGDSIVGSADLLAWKAGYGTTGNAVRTQGDADGDLDVDGGDFLVWQRQLGSAPPVTAAPTPVPEPATVVLLILAATGLRARQSRAG